MRIKSFSLLVIIIFLSEIGNSQSWKLFSREQKDSIIFHSTDKGKMSIGLGLGGAFLSGGWKGGAIKIEPAIGFLFNKNQQFLLSFILEYGNLRVDTSYVKSCQLRLGNYYRFYLPQRKVMSPFFLHAGIQYGYFKGELLDEGELIKEECFQLTIAPGVGILIPINKFRLEILFTKEFELFNIETIKQLSGPRSVGQITFSYYF